MILGYLKKKKEKKKKNATIKKTNNLWFSNEYVSVSVSINGKIAIESRDHETEKIGKKLYERHIKKI